MGRFDISMKHLLLEHARDWASFFKVPDDVPVRVIESDLSSVTSLADKVFDIGGKQPFILHLEPHSYYERWLDLRMFEANARLAKRHRKPVHSCALLLDQQAWGRANRGYYRAASPVGRCGVDFHYDVVKVWELGAEELLTSGVGLLPLAPVSAVSRQELPNIVARMDQRLRDEVPQAVAADIWTATLVLVGLRYDREFASLILRGVRETMKQSSTYQMILEEGLEEGLSKGVVQGRRGDILLLGTKKFGKPTAEVKATLEAMTDAAQLETLLTRILDVSSWVELLTVKKTRSRKT